MYQLTQREIDEITHFARVRGEDPNQLLESFKARREAEIRQQVDSVGLSGLDLRAREHLRFRR